VTFDDFDLANLDQPELGQLPHLVVARRSTFRNASKGRYQAIGER